MQLEERINIQILRVEGLNKDMVFPYQHITGKMGMSAFEILGLVEDCLCETECYCLSIMIVKY